MSILADCADRGTCSVGSGIAYAAGFLALAFVVWVIFR